MRSLSDERAALLADADLSGRRYCETYSNLVDSWFAELFVRRIGPVPDLALVALGGYGRSALFPHSDLDVMLLHRGWSEEDLADAAQKLWYPVWDAGISLGHSVRTVNQAIELAENDFETATALLSTRWLAGAHSLVDDLRSKWLASWYRNIDGWLLAIVEGAAQRQAESGEVAFMLEPDVKLAGGGLRDLDAIRWLSLGGIELHQGEKRDLADAGNVLVKVRVALHRLVGRRGDRLLLEEQDAVAEMLGNQDADVMMSHVSAAGRTITWIANGVFLRVENLLARRNTPRGTAQSLAPPMQLSDGISLSEGAVALNRLSLASTDPTALLRIALLAAQHEARIDRATLEALVAAAPLDLPLNETMRQLLVDLLLTGHAAIEVIETLDHVGLFTRILPHWEPNRSRVQRNQYHRFTVDRHLLEACAEAAGLADRVERPDLLVVGALLHDIGKGYPGDHTEAGIELIQQIGPNLGFGPADTDTLVRLCRHHLLLPDTATRRDIEDPETLHAVAAKVETAEFLHLLGALTEADSIATGPSAWSRWKSHLVSELVKATEDLLLTGSATAREFPTTEQRELVANKQETLVGEGSVLTLVLPDRVGLGSRVFGALALSGMHILDAQLHTEGAWALQVIRVRPIREHSLAIDWPTICQFVRETVRDNRDLMPEFEARRRSLLQRPNLGVPFIDTSIDFVESAHATIVEVKGPDRAGLLYQLTTEIANCGLNLKQAKVQTLSGEVVDVFFVTKLDGSKLVSASERTRLVTRLRAILDHTDA